MTIARMESATGALLVLSTAGSLKEGKRIARALVEEKLAACVTLRPEVTSIYSWEGKIAEESECLLLIKTRTPRLRALTERLTALHSYDVPEVIALPIDAAYLPYQKWLEEQTRG